jgi:phosphate transport system substrate-binding protein
VNSSELKFQPVICMRQTRTSSYRFPLKVLFNIVLTSVLLWGVESSARAQSAVMLSQVKKVYVESFGTDEAASNLRESLIDRLRKTGSLEVVRSPNEADAIIKGTGSIWVTGYVSTSLRSAANSRQAVSSGFLSVEIVGKGDEPLWSYLVTPRTIRLKPVAQDLADQLASKLAVVLRQKSDGVPPSLANENPVGTTVNGAGATFPAPLYEKWFESFQESNPSVHIKYSAVGSDAGLQLLAEGKVDFAASDVPLIQNGPAGSTSTLLRFATVLGAVVPVYNSKGVNRNLDFTADVLAGIYLGKIKKWNDPRIRASNKNAFLPDSDIAVIHRSDGSGTTFAWTDYLSKANPEWKTAVGASTIIQWPVGAGAEGNDGVASMVQQTPNSIGYVELVYALRHQLNFGAVRNAAGEFVQADIASMSAAASGTDGTTNSEPRLSITNAEAKGAYPIATFTWWLLPKDLGGADKQAALLPILRWMLTTGQKQCSALGYAPLPGALARRELQTLSELK